MINATTIKLSKKNDSENKFRIGTKADGTKVLYCYVSTTELNVPRVIDSVEYNIGQHNITEILDGYNANMMTLSGDYTATLAGTYTCYITPKPGYYWNTETKDASTKELAWTITKRRLQVPTLVNTTVKYTAVQIKPEFTNFISGRMYYSPSNIVDIGEYNLQIGLYDTNNYEWAEDFNGCLSTTLSVVKA